MAHSVTTIGIKIAALLAAAIVSFLLAENNYYGWAVLLALIIAAVTYLLDRSALRAVGNIITSIIEGLIAALVALALSIAVPEFTAPPATLVLFGALVTLVEYIVHLQLRDYSKTQTR